MAYQFNKFHNSEWRQMATFARDCTAIGWYQDTAIGWPASRSGAPKARNNKTDLLRANKKNVQLLFEGLGDYKRLLWKWNNFL